MVKHQPRDLRLASSARHRSTTPQTPGKWRNADARALVLSSPEITQTSAICKPCRDDIAQCLANSEHIPRWEKRKSADTECCIQSCDRDAHHNTTHFSLEEMATLCRQAGIESNALTTPTPICKHHYHFLYNLQNPSQTKCTTCLVPLRYSKHRLCPEPETIELYLQQTTEFNGKILPNSVICNTCYKLHLWEAVTQLTMSKNERCGKSKENTTKRTRRFFIVSAILFCTNDQYSMPLHTLLTDMVHSQGGSDLLIRILNRLGVCASFDTLLRYIQYKVQCSNVKEGNDLLKPDAFTIVSADNIDTLHSYAQVCKGVHSSSWHGTSIQAVQPLPSLSSIDDIEHYVFGEEMEVNDEEN